MGVNAVSILVSLPFILTYFSGVPEYFFVLFFALALARGSHLFQTFVAERLPSIAL
jgi:hypothetical protein